MLAESWSSLSHFVPSLLGRLLRGLAEQGEVGARLSLGKAGKRAVRKTRVGPDGCRWGIFWEALWPRLGKGQVATANAWGGGARGAVRD